MYYTEEKRSRSLVVLLLVPVTPAVTPATLDEADEVDRLIISLQDEETWASSRLRADFSKWDTFVTPTRRRVAIAIIRSRRSLIGMILLLLLAGMVAVGGSSGVSVELSQGERLLIQMRDEERLNWNEIVEAFAARRGGLRATKKDLNVTCLRIRDMLAGLIDSDGYCYARGRYFYINQSVTGGHEPLFWDIVYLARSPGFHVSTYKYYNCQRSVMSRGLIPGDVAKIPCLLSRKMALSRGRGVPQFPLRDARLEEEETEFVTIQVHSEHKDILLNNHLIVTRCSSEFSYL